MAESFPNIPRQIVYEAIKYGLMTVQHAIPTGQHDENKVYAHAYITRFDLFRDLDDLDAAVEILRKEHDNQTLPAIFRYDLADLWAETANKYNHSSQMEAHISKINCLITYVLEAFNMVELTESLNILTFLMPLLLQQSTASAMVLFKMLCTCLEGAGVFYGYGCCNFNTVT